MANTNENVNVNTEAVMDDEPIKVVVEQKEGFGTKCKNFFGKVANSTPGKIIGGVLLVGLGAAGTLLCVALGSGNDDDEEEETTDYSEYIVDDEDKEVSDEEVAE